MFEASKPESIYYLPFGSSIGDDSVDLPYGDDFMDLDVKEIDTRYQNELDNLIGAQISLPGRDGLPLLAIVKKRKLNFKGEPVGSYDPSPMLDSRIYELKFPDGRVEEYAVNVILENMADQVKSNDWDASLFDEIVSAAKDEETVIKKGDGAFTLVDGIKTPVITTKGWKIQIKWKDGSLSWHPMAIVKSSNPIELAEYAVSNKLSDEPAFRWWVKSTLKERNRLIHKSKTKTTVKNIKFGVEVPSTVEEALRLDLAINLARGHS